MDFIVGDKIIYGENGVCTVCSIGPLEMTGSDPDKLYYHLKPMIGTGTYFAPVHSNAFMRHVISKSEAEDLVSRMSSIEPAICNDTRFNHVDAFYKELFKLHTPEAMVSVIKGLYLRINEKKTKSTRAESTMKRAKDILFGELSVALSMSYSDVEQYMKGRIDF